MIVRGRVFHREAPEKAILVLYVYPWPRKSHICYRQIKAIVPRVRIG